MRVANKRAENIRLIAELISLELSFDESKHPRDHGKFTFKGKSETSNKSSKNNNRSKKKLKGKQNKSKSVEDVAKIAEYNNAFLRKHGYLDKNNKPISEKQRKIDRNKKIQRRINIATKLAIAGGIFYSPLIAAKIDDHHKERYDPADWWKKAGKKSFIKDYPASRFIRKNLGRLRGKARSLYSKTPMGKRALHKHIQDSLLKGISRKLV